MIIKPKIIVDSPWGTGSTLLYNMVVGATKPDQRYQFSKLLTKYELTELVYKSHVLAPDAWRTAYPLSSGYDFYFIAGTRKFKCGHVPPRVRRVLNMQDERLLILDYKDFATVNTDRACQVVYEQLKLHLPAQLFHSRVDAINVSSMIARVHLMNARYEQIKDEPWDFVDPVFGIHGGHRTSNNRVTWSDRGKKCKKCKK